MGATSRTISYDALMSLTLENYRATLVDNVFASSVTLSALKKAKNGVRMVNGGERIRVPLLYGKNTTAKSYSGYDPLDTTPQDGITATFATWAQIAVAIAISRLEERQNNQEHQIKSLLESKILQAESSVKELLNHMILGKTFSSGAATEGNGGKDLTPLTKLIPKNPTASVSVQAINQSTESWWRSRSLDGSSNGATSKDAGALRGWDLNTWAELKMAMKTTYNFCSRGGGGSPNMVLTDQDGFENFENALEQKVQYVQTEARLPFDHIAFKPGCPIYWDEMVPDLENGVSYESASAATSSFLFLNTEYIYLAVDTETYFINTPFIRPVGQDAKVAEILFMGQLVATNRRKLGCLYGVARGITS